MEEKKLSIFEACERDDIKRVKECLQEGVDINCTDEDGNTPLIYSSIIGRFEIVKLLIEKKADVNAVNKENLKAHEATTSIKIKRIFTTIMGKNPSNQTKIDQIKLQISNVLTNHNC